MNTNYYKLIKLSFSDEEIFSIAFDTINGYHRNPLRKDKNPGCRFDYIDGELVFRDFAWPNSPVGNRPLDAITFAKLYLKTENTRELLTRLYELKKNGKLKNIANDLKGEKKISATHGKTTKNVFVYPEEWNDDNLEYWKQYGIKGFYLDRSKDLRVFVYPISKFIIKEKEYIENAYAYVYNGCIKIYRPLNKPKFLGNCKENNIGGKFINADITILTKSLKDFEVLRRQIKDVNIIYFQNEGMLPDYNQIEKYFKGKSIIITMDNDKAGKKAAEKYKNYFSEISENVSIILPDSNDWAEAILNKNYGEFKKLKNEVFNYRSGR